MNTTAFAEEVAVDSVDEVAVDEAAVGTVDGVEVTLDEEASKANTLSDNVMNWYAQTDGTLMARYFIGVSGASDGKSILSDHLVNGQKVIISRNQPADEGGYYGHIAWPGWKHDLEKDKWYSTLEGSDWWSSGAVSSNVFKLDDKTYLMIAYTIEGADLNVNNGTETNVPVVQFNGKKYVDVSNTKYDKNGEVKFDKNQNCAIRVEGALVTQEEGKAPVLIANNLSFNSAKKPKSKLEIVVKPYNNQYANVSMNELFDKEYNPLGYPDISKDNPYLKEGDYPYFTINVKINADKDDTALKDAKKLIKKAKSQKGVELSKQEFRFDIRRSEYASAGTISPDYIKGENHNNYKEVDNAFKHRELDVAANASVTYQNFAWKSFFNLPSQEASYDVGKLALFTNAKSVKNKIPVYVINDKKNDPEVSSESGWSRKGVYSSYKLKENKDYTVDSSLVEGAIVLKPTGNFEGDGAVFRSVEYTIPAGWSDGQYYPKETTIKEVRSGVYDFTGEDAGHFYVDSVED